MEKATISSGFPLKTLIFLLFFLSEIPLEKSHNYAKKPKFTHFLSLPLLTEAFKQEISVLQSKILSILPENDRKKLFLNSPDLMHITLSVLNLEEEPIKAKALELFDKMKEKAEKFVKEGQIQVNLGGLELFGYKDPKIEKFSKKSKDSKPAKNTGVIFLDVIEDGDLHRLRRLANVFLKEFVDGGVINKGHLKEMNMNHDADHDVYHPLKYHITLFRFENGVDLTEIIEEFKTFKFGEIKPESIHLSVMGNYDEKTRFYQHLKKHLL